MLMFSMSVLMFPFQRLGTAAGHRTESDGHHYGHFASITRACMTNQPVMSSPETSKSINQQQKIIQKENALAVFFN